MPFKKNLRNIGNSFSALPLMAPRAVAASRLVSLLLLLLAELHFHYAACAAHSFSFHNFLNFHIYLFAFSNEDTKRRAAANRHRAIAIVVFALMATNCQNVNEPKCLQGGRAEGQRGETIIEHKVQRIRSGNDFQLAAKQTLRDSAYLCGRRVRFAQIILAADNGINK